MTLKEIIKSEEQFNNIVEYLIIGAAIDADLINLNENITDSCKMTFGNNLVTDNTDENTLKKAIDKLLSVDFNATSDKSSCLSAILTKLGKIDDNCDCDMPAKNAKVTALDSLQKLWNQMIIKYGKDLANPSKAVKTFNAMKGILADAFKKLKS